MADIATLGLSVTSKDVVQATAALTEMAGAATKAEKSADSLARADRVMGASLAALQSEMKSANASLASIAASSAAAVTAMGQLSTASAKVGQSFSVQPVRQFSEALKPINDNAKLTSTQLLNLSRQGNDVATMFALGASPMQIFASQAGQVVDALQSGPGGLGGSLKAIGAGLLSLVTPINLTIAGLAGATAAAIYFGTKSKDAVLPLDDAMKAHRQTIEEVAKAYGIALDAGERFGSLTEASFRGRRSENQLRTSQRASLLDNFVGNTDVLRTGRDEEGQYAPRAASKYSDFNAPLVALAKSVKEGRPDVEAFVKSVADIANSQPANLALQKLADDLLKLADPAAEAQRQIDALARSMEKVQAARLNGAMSDLRSFLPDRRSDRDRVNETADRASMSARSYGELQEIERQRLAGLAEIDRKEGDIRKGRELDLRSITARTVAERAAIAGEQERLAVSDLNISAAEKEARVQSQVKSVLATATEEARRYALDRQRGNEDTISSLRSEIELMGATPAGEMGIDVMEEFAARGLL